MSAVSVTNVATLIISANAQRISIVIENNGSVPIYIGPDTSVSFSNGVPILQNGNLTEDSGGDKMYLGNIYGITSSSNCDVRYWERTR